MHLRTLGAASALALFAGVSAGAFAQAPGGGPPQGTQERMQTPGQSSPGQKQTTPGQRGQSQAQEPGQRQGQQAQEPGLRKGQQAQEPGQRKGQQAEEPGLRKGQQAQEPGQRKGQQAQEPGQRKGQQAEGTETKQKQRAEQPEGKQQRQRAEQPEGKQQKQRAEQPEGKQRQRVEEPTQGRQKQQAQEPAKGKEQQRAGREGRVQLSEQQRTTVRERIRQSGDLDRARVADVNFNIAVGTTVPRDRVRLVPLPTVIVEEVPQYRGFVYFVARDELVIVNPQSYVVVDVIRIDGATGRTATRGAGQTQARLSLSPQQRQIVLSRIEMQPSVRLGIGDISIGMDVPRQVELRTFPASVVQDVPELRSYRYFVFENEVAIVDPQQRNVVLTISE